MSNKEELINLANQTIKILDYGQYKSASGKVINIKNSVEKSIQNTELYKPDFDYRSIVAENKYNTKIEITLESTASACNRFVTDGYEDIGCLNFASAKNPGGGFLSGSRAQEESLARATALYPCICNQNEYYLHNRSLKTGFYSDYIIYSPNVIFFRDDNGKLLDKPYEISIITSPAVNAGVVMSYEKENESKIKDVMINRLKKIHMEQI